MKDIIISILIGAFILFILIPISIVLVAMYFQKFLYPILDWLGK